MWTCSKCGRIFEKEGQVHSCQIMPLEKHFENKEKAKEIFEHLFKKINKEVGKCEIVSLPCCVHLFGSFDFLAALPKRDRLEIRFVLNSVLRSPRLKQAVPVSAKGFKYCIDVCKIEEIDGELVGWIGEAYHLKDK